MQWLQNTTMEYFNVYNWSLPNNIEPDCNVVYLKPTMHEAIANMEEKSAVKSKVTISIFGYLIKMLNFFLGYSQLVQTPLSYQAKEKACL
jgi:hypothetical protein